MSAEPAGETPVEPGDRPPRLNRWVTGVALGVLGVLAALIFWPSHGPDTLDLSRGVVGDNWLERGSRHTETGEAHPQCQVTVMNIHVASLVAGSHDRVPLAGDQLYVDFDLSHDNLPPGSRLRIGTAVLAHRLREVRRQVR